MCSRSHRLEARGVETADGQFFWTLAQQQRELARRAVAAPRRIGERCAQRAKTLAQQRFDGVFPAGVDVQRLPQRRSAFDIAAAIEARCR